MPADVAQEVVAGAALLELGVALEVAQVVVERELDVHVEREPVGQQEREVGDPGLDGVLLAVVDALHEPVETEDVVGHALAPLTARLGARERLSQALRRLCEHRQLLVRVLDRARELAELQLAVALQLAHELLRRARPRPSSSAPCRR